MNRWEQLPGRPSGADYAARFERLAASGRNAHGEADRCALLVDPPARVLDAGCGTGRVAIELSRRGFDCVGVEIDEEMLDIARRAGPDVTWVRADLAELALPPAGTAQENGFDLVVAAGNVIPLLAVGTEAEAIARLAEQLREGGLLVAGFGLDAEHLPLDDAPFTIAQYDAWCAAAGLSRRDRWSTWDGEPWDDGGYAVSVHVVAGAVRGGADGP